MLVLRGSRILVPKSLKENVLKLAHEGHPGIVVMKRNLWTKLWWPGIDREAEKFCRSCNSCQLVSSPEKSEPMKSTDIPSSPWEHISADLMCLPTGDNLFVVVDYYSRYFEVDVMRSTTTDRIVRSLRKMVLTHGLPVSRTTDNGPQFRSSDFKDYLESEVIMHRKTTPLWPQANGEVERQNRTLLKRMRIAFAEKRNSISDTSVEEDVEITDRDGQNKGKGKLYADARRQAKESDIGIGDKVLVKQDKQDKLTPNFYDEPYKVIEKSGNAITVTDGRNAKYKRTITHVKQYNDADGKNKDCTSEIPEDCVPPQSDDTNLEDSNDTPVPSTSRPKREARLPARFKDSVMSD
ncbi:uncharacterized protein K02A2.6-like [Ostrea edulis]|uniref:uncharacterized protein K02A2.6-like n=1 Tax=Ostrea edulis TaxID=37623 RepID=UPI002094BA06|nr:uncharacterized protein K02A2.6-like [Ostrea edulis]